MGLTSSSTGIGAADFGMKKHSGKIIALAGNPNVGKSTVFNGLTGLRQHTGNWPGKTVVCASGICNAGGRSYVLTDIPGTYSLLAHSAEEEVARDFICFGSPDAVIAVCDATCLERNLNLVLQILEITDNVVVCLNLMDEAKKKNIKTDVKGLSEKLGVPVIPTAAASGKGLGELMEAVSEITGRGNHRKVAKINYPPHIRQAIDILEPAISAVVPDCRIKSGWLAVKLLEGDEKLCTSINEFLGINLAEAVEAELAEARAIIAAKSTDTLLTADISASAAVMSAEEICRNTVDYDEDTYNERDRKIDRILTGRIVGYPLMVLLLAVILWITVAGANYPTQLLTYIFEKTGNLLFGLLGKCNVPPILTDMLIGGVYGVLTKVIAVMLPPMAIFFPLFTLLEDLGYLPRVAFNLDKPLKKCSACGKQALTMCMGFGCNAAGVVGCRIIDSPRERLIAVLTNSFVPCNGRFPLIILVAAMFFAAGSSFMSAFAVTLAVIAGIIMTFAVSKILSVTLLKGEPSSFALELPPYRKPAVGRIIVRSVMDRTLFVLGRAAIAAAPAGLLIWLMTHISIGGTTILGICSSFLDPLGRLMGLDGVILFAFILGIPANEIVMPIILMAYTASTAVVDGAGVVEMQSILAANGWTLITAVNTVLFSIMHWPCATTLMTIKKETGSMKWTALAFLIPTAAGVIICTITAAVMRFIL